MGDFAIPEEKNNTCGNDGTRFQCTEIHLINKKDFTNFLAEPYYPPPIKTYK
jgi:hypothetical protein